MPPHLAHWAASADIAPLPDSLAVALRQLLGRTGTLSPAVEATCWSPTSSTQVQQSRLAATAARHPPRVTSSPRSRPSAAARDEHRLWREADLRWRLTRRQL